MDSFSSLLLLNQIEVVFSIVLPLVSILIFVILWIDNSFVYELFKWHALRTALNFYKLLLISMIIKHLNFLYLLVLTESLLLH